jgi:hypothetical protein
LLGVVGGNWAGERERVINEEKLALGLGRMGAADDTGGVEIGP